MVGFSLQCRQNQEDGHVDFYDEVQVVTGEQGGHLTDDEQHEGGQEDRHHVAGERPAEGDVHKDSSVFLFVDVAMVDGLEDVLQQLFSASVDNLLPSDSDLLVRHVEDQGAVLVKPTE